MKLNSKDSIYVKVLEELTDKDEEIPIPSLSEGMMRMSLFGLEKADDFNIKLNILSTINDLKKSVGDSHEFDNNDSNEDVDNYGLAFDVQLKKWFFMDIGNRYDSELIVFSKRYPEIKEYMDNNFPKGWA